MNIDMRNPITGTKAKVNDTNGMHNDEVIYCPVNGTDCCYCDECLVCHIEDPMEECDDFASMFDSWEEWEEL